MFVRSFTIGKSTFLSDKVFEELVCNAKELSRASHGERGLVMSGHVVRALGLAFECYSIFSVRTGDSVRFREQYSKPGILGLFYS